LPAAEESGRKAQISHSAEKAYAAWYNGKMSEHDRNRKNAVIRKLTTRGGISGKKADDYFGAIAPVPGSAQIRRILSRHKKKTYMHPNGRRMQKQKGILFHADCGVRR